MWPGQTVRIQVAGMPFDVKIPQGSYPGSTFQVRVPKRRSSPSRQRPPGLDLLTGMGFPEDKAIQALQSSNGDVQQAAIMLSSATLG